MTTDREAQLAAAKRRATGLLVAVTVAFLAVSATDPDPSGLSGYLQAALEASMVGGLADWFAVVAIFHRPLGLPIPHTAVIVERKDAFGRTLGEFIQENLLDPAAVLERVQDRQVVPRAAAWLAEPANADKVAGHLVGLLATAADVIEDEDLHRLLERELVKAVDAVPLAPLAGRTLRSMTGHGRDDQAFDTILRLAERLMADYRAPLRERFTRDVPWWMPKGVERRIFDRLFDGLADLLAEAKADSSHQLRLQARTALNGLADRLERDPEMLARGEELKHQLLTDPAIRRLAAGLGARVKEVLRDKGADSQLRQALADMVMAGGRRLGDDPELQARALSLLSTGAQRAIDRFGGDIAELVGSQIARWDAAETAARLELLLGRDLQFIRINGTVVGGLAGLVIHAAAQAVG